MTPVVGDYFYLFELVLLESYLKIENSILLKSFDSNISLVNLFLNVLDSVFNYFMVAATLRVVELAQKNK